MIGLVGALTLVFILVVIVSIIVCLYCCIVKFKMCTPIYDPTQVEHVYHEDLTNVSQFNYGRIVKL